MITGALCGSEISGTCGALLSVAKRLSSTRSSSTSSSGLMSMDSATAPISSEAVSEAMAPNVAPAWNTTKANSPPCASISVNTGRSW